MPYTPEQNDVAEQCNHTLMDMRKSMKSRSVLPEYLWGEVIKTIAYMFNKIPNKYIYPIHHLSYGLEGNLV